MIKILAISGSPVEQSSTDMVLNLLMSTLVEQINDSHAQLVRLNDLKFIPCQACGKAPAHEFCFFDDDMTDLYKAVEEADCLLLGSPIYFDSVSAQTKSFIDRCNCFRPPDYENKNPDHLFIKKLKTKRPGAMVLIGGEECWFEGARRTIAGFFKWIEVVNEGMISFSTPDYNIKGAAIDDNDLIKQVTKMSKTLALKLRESK